MLTYFTINSGFASSTLEVTGGLLNDLSPYLTLVLGTMLVVLIAGVLITRISK